MAAGAIRILIQYPKKQIMTIRGALTVIRVKQTTNANTLQQNFLHPLAG